MTCVVGLIVINCENDLISDVLGETHVCRINFCVTFADFYDVSSLLSDSSLAF